MPYRAPDTLTTAEQARLLQVTGRHVRPRDHVLFSTALGTGLRLSELLGLNVGDVTPDGRRVRSRVRLRAETTKNGRRSDVFLPDRLVRKLERFLQWKRMMGESLEVEAPLFLSSWGRRLSPRRAQMSFQEWQRRAGFDRTFRFHGLRHASVTNVWRATHDLFLAQRFARHASPLTTTVYCHPGDEEMSERLRDLAC
jgi:integrase/recombinase XerC